MKFTREILSSRNQKGIAILMAVFCVVLVTYIVTEVSYETSIEYAIHAGSVNRLKAYYAARSGVELSLLRIKLYRKIQQQYGKQMGQNAGLLNMIWSFPLSWPPVLPEEASGVDQEMLNDKIKLAKMDATFNATIFDEGSKIDLNDLASPSKTLRKSTEQQLLKVFAVRMETDENFRREHSGFRPEELVNNIIDWVDGDKTSLNGGDERAQYRDLDGEVENFPPNRSFRTLEELRLVAGMTDEFYAMLAPNVTVYGAKAINPNTASREVIKSLDPSITDEVVTEVLQQREKPNGAFQCANNDFWDFMNGKGARIDPATIEQTPITCDGVINFRIRSIGEYNGAIRQIDAVVFDVESSAKVVADRAKKDAKPEGEREETRDDSTTRTTAPTNQTASKGPPRIVYWTER